MRRGDGTVADPRRHGGAVAEITVAQARIAFGAQAGEEGVEIGRAEIDRRRIRTTGGGGDSIKPRRQTRLSAQKLSPVIPAS
jgi:hypothetical protein